MAARRFLTGSSALVRGFGLLRREPSLWVWILIPWLINLSVLFIGWTQGLGALQVWVNSLIASWVTTGWLFDVFYYFFLVFFGLAFVVVWLMAVMAVAVIVAAPFNAIMAEKALRKQGFTGLAFDGWRAWLSHSGRMLLISLVKAAIFATAAMLLFICSFVPGLNLVAAYLSMCIFAADVFDYSFEAQGLSLRQRLARWRELRPEVLGLGAMLSLTSLIPGLTVLALPVAVLGATTILSETKNS